MMISCPFAFACNWPHFPRKIKHPHYSAFSLEYYTYKKIITTGVWSLISMLQRDHYFRRLGAKNFTLSLWCISLAFCALAKWKWWTPQDVRVAHDEAIYCSTPAYVVVGAHAYIVHGTRLFISALGRIKIPPLSSWCTKFTSAEKVAGT